MTDGQEQEARAGQSATDPASESGHIVPLNEPIDIPFRDPAALSQFLQEPLVKIAEAMTGALSAGRPEAILIGGRLIQGALKGKLLQQVSREIRALIEKGQIKEDYAKSKVGFKSLVELLSFIDDEVPDEDRLKAVKAMFVAINSVSAKEGDEILNYALLQIAKRLSASQLMVLKISYDFFNQRTLQELHITDTHRWLEEVAKREGHGVSGLIEQDDKVLVEAGLLTSHTFSDGSGINATNGRLTDLGVRFCTYLDEFGD